MKGPIPCHQCRFNETMHGKRLCEHYRSDSRPCTWAYYAKVPDKLRKEVRPMSAKGNEM